jgi:prepilin-type N-terminal cleavage/methylation domain-containing protein
MPRRSDRRTEEIVKKENSVSTFLSGLRKRRRSQKGFTLIEMLVVISILGILAAIVTMSMVGVTNLARSRANDAEKQTVQVALDTMANDKNLPAGGICPAPAPNTNDMSQFPYPVAVGATPDPRDLYPTYIRNHNTSQTYTCDPQGNVSVP